MTFLGKILTVVIFVFSLVLMSFALMVGAAHVNYRDKDKATTDILQRAQLDNEALRLENDRLARAIESEIVSRRVEVAKLEATRLALTQQLDAVQKENQANIDTLGKKSAALTSAETALAEKQKAIDGLRTEIRATQEERDKTLLQVADVADKNHQLALALTNLQRRGVELTGQIVSLKKTLAAFDIPEHTDVTGIPPPIAGKVTAVRNNGQEITLVVSLGGDDGMKEGHEMNVFRGRDLIGRIRLVRVDPDRAVGRSDPTYYKRPFQVGDDAQTITPKASLDRQANNKK